jgi:hypothetical protein
LRRIAPYQIGSAPLFDSRRRPTVRLGPTLPKWSLPRAKKRLSPPALAIVGYQVPSVPRNRDNDVLKDADIAVLPGQMVAYCPNRRPAIRRVWKRRRRHEQACIVDQQKMCQRRPVDDRKFAEQRAFALGASCHSARPMRIEPEQGRSSERSYELGQESLAIPETKNDIPFRCMPASGSFMKCRREFDSNDVRKSIRGPRSSRTRTFRSR